MSKQICSSRNVQDQRSDSDLVQLICEGDESALDAVIGLYAGPMTALCKRICSDELEANSVVSDVFWEFWRNATLFRAQRGSLRCYLLTMARSRALDRYRSTMSLQKRHSLYAASAVSQLNNDTSDERPENGPIRAEQLREVQTALQQLPDLQRQSLSFAFFDGLTHREVSERMGLPLGSVKTHIRSGLLKLKYLLATICEPREYS